MIRYIMNYWRMARLAPPGERKLFFNRNIREEKTRSEGLIPESKCWHSAERDRTDEVVAMQHNGSARASFGGYADGEGRATLPQMTLSRTAMRVPKAVDENISRFVASTKMSSRVGRRRKSDGFIREQLLNDERDRREISGDQYGISREGLPVEDSSETKLKTCLKKELRCHRRRVAPISRCLTRLS